MPVIVALFVPIRKYYCFVAVLLFVLLQVTSSKANHLMGSDITYHCIAKWKYQVTLTVYRDCNGINLGATQPLKVVCSNSSWNTIVFLKFTQKHDITGLNAQCNANSKCAGGTYPYGVEEYIYTEILDLSSVACTEFVLSWTTTARNAAITTGAAGGTFYTEAKLYTNLSECNSSPIFGTPAAALVCLGSDFTFNNGAIDTFDTNDSLSYKFTDPLEAAGDAIPYYSGWSATMPITFFGYPNANRPIPQGFHLDPITGNLSFRPIVLNEASVIVLEVTEWRKENGNMRVVGITRRDMQIVVINCGNNSPPTIIGESVSACPNQEVCIKITTTDANSGDSVKLSWNRGITAATFVSSEGTIKQDTATICWTPTENDIRTTPYVFTITARDNGCPLGGQAVKAFTIYVDSRPRPSYVVNDTDQCFKGQQFDFINTSTTNSGSFTTNWSFSDGQTIDSMNAKNIRFNTPGDFGVKLKLTSFYGCEDSAMSEVTVFPQPNPDFVQLNNYYCTNKPSIYLQPAVAGGEFGGKNVVDSIYKHLITGPDTITYKINVNGCESDTVKYTMVYPKPVLNLGIDTFICQTEAIQFDVSFPNSTYLWQDGITFPKYMVNYAGLYKVTLFNVCDTLTDSAKVSTCRYSFFPNAFTPNNDGDNDVFYPVFAGASNINMKIFDRWGELIFESTELDKGWDGNFKTGGAAPIGVYTWIIELKFNNLEVIRNQTESGTLTLLR